MHYRAIIGRRDQWREAQTKKADNIEIPAKDNNITGGNSIEVLTYSFTNIRFINNFLLHIKF